VVELNTNPQTETGVFTYSLNDYRSKLEEIIRSENEKFRLLAEQQAKDITNDAWQKAEETISQSQTKADEIIRQSEQKAEEAVTLSQQKAREIIGNSEEKAAKIVSDSHRKAEEIYNDSRQKALSVKEETIRQAKEEANNIVIKANREAQQTIREAEESAKKDAKNRVKAEEEKIITRAREEYNSIITKARQEAQSIVTKAKEDSEKQTAEIIDSSKKEAEQLFRNEIERCQALAQAQSDQIRTEAEKKADTLIKDLVNGGKEVHSLISETMANTENLMVKVKEEMLMELGELTKRIVESEKKLQDITNGYVREYDNKVNNTQIPGNANTSDSLWVILKRDNDEAGIGENGYYNGEIELKTLSSFDVTRIKNVKRYFTQIPNVKYLGEFSSEEGTKISFDLKEPLPLLDILKNMPSIEKVVEEGGNLKLTVH